MTAIHVEGRRNAPQALFLAGILAFGPGCLNAPLQPTNQEKIGQTTAAPRPVTADQVDTQNARAQLAAVRKELALEP